MSHVQPPEGTVGERIRGLLSERGMSQRQLAAALAGDGAPTNSVENMRRQISSWVNDQHVPSPENAEALAAQLDVPVEWIADAPTGRASMASALTGLGEVVGVLSEHLEQAEAHREVLAGEAAEILRGIDQRLDRHLGEVVDLLREMIERQAHMIEGQGRLLEGQIAGFAALAELGERSDAPRSTRSTRRSGNA